MAATGWSHARLTVMLDDAFWAIHSDLPREGPGDNASTARALSAMTDLPPKLEFHESSATDVLTFVASIFARGHTKK